MRINQSTQVRIKNGFLANTPGMVLRRKIRKQVFEEYGAALEQTTGWQKLWLMFKIKLVAEIRYQGLLFQGPVRL